MTEQRIRVFVVTEGERFDIQVAGPSQNLGDPTGVFGGRTYEYVVSNRHLRPLTVYKIVPPMPCNEKVIEEDYR